LENVTTTLFGASTKCLIQFVDAAQRRVEFAVTLKAGNRYRVTVTHLRSLGSSVSRVNCYRSVGTGQKQFKAGLSGILPAT